MLSFYDSSRLGAIRVDDIERFGSEREQKGKATVRVAHLRDGKAFDVLEHDFDRIMVRPMQLIPAQPGINLIRAYCGDGVPGELIREQVIAWALCADGEIRAVSPQGVNGGGGRFTDYYVEMPDGGVQSVGEWADIASFDDAGAMLKHFEAKAAPRDAAS